MAPAIIDKFKHALHLDKKEHKEEKKEAKKGEVKKEEVKEAAPTSAAPEAATESPKFKREDVTVVFVLGGPGAGKHYSLYTQCNA